jgi:hypothetical protein
VWKGCSDCSTSPPAAAGERSRYAKRAIEVAGVQEGSEEDLRQLLDGALLQVASDYGLKLGEQACAPEKDANAERERRMTERFRGFAQD